MEHQLKSLLEKDGVSILDRLKHWSKTKGNDNLLFYGETNETLSYSEFDKITNQIANTLTKLGIKKGDHVSTYIRNQFIGTQFMFAIWKIGAVYAPINFNLTGSLLAYQINDTKPKLLLYDALDFNLIQEVWGEIKTPPIKIIYSKAPHQLESYKNNNLLDINLNKWEDIVQTGSSSNPNIEVNFNDPANIIYTSGTTGPAKGVLISHRWMNQYTFMFRQVLNPNDIVYNDLPLYHVGGAVFNIVRAIWAGSAIACWDRFSPNSFWERINLSKATSAVLVDTMISWLAKANCVTNDNEHTLTKVHMQPLPAQHHQLAKRFGFDFITCGFGQTESGMPCFALIEETNSENETPDKFKTGATRTQILQRLANLKMEAIPYSQASSIKKGYLGKATPFFEVCVLDEKDQKERPDSFGQLAVRPKLPALLLSEYLSKPKATLAAFQNLWFHTGDLAYINYDNSFNFVDRMGDRIRVRGENTSSFHIEDIVNQCPGVIMSAAFGIPAEEGFENDIAIFVVSNSSCNEAQIRAWSIEHMPKFMQPKHIRIIDSLPRTMTQKIEKFKLKEQLLKELQSFDYPR